jgi:hypothetical protein
MSYDCVFFIAQPSSSSLAALPLEYSGPALTGFIGLDALSGDLGFGSAAVQPTSITTSGAECADGDLRMGMRGMTKKDFIIRLKVESPIFTSVELSLS